MQGVRIVVICGTGTEVGKTWVAARLAEHLVGLGLTVAARKPVQSFDGTATGAVGTATGAVGTATGAVGTAPELDSVLLARATGEDPFDVCPAHRSYPVAMAPPMAAAASGGPPFTIGDLVAETRFPEGVDLGLIETAGGVFSPQADDGDVVDLVAAVDPDHVVIVADAGLGTINAVRSSVLPLVDHGPVVVLNRFDPDSDLHRANECWLRERCGLDVFTSVSALAAGLAAGVAGGPAEGSGSATLSDPGERS